MTSIRCGYQSFKNTNCVYMHDTGDMYVQVKGQYLGTETNASVTTWYVSFTYKVQSTRYTWYIEVQGYINWNTYKIYRHAVVPKRDTLIYRYPAVV